MSSNSGISVLLSNKIDKNENEEKFQKAYDEKDTDGMWFSVFAACSNICKSIYRRRNVIIPDDELYEKITDSTAYCMKFILNRGVRPEKLSSYCYLRCLRFINDKKEIEKNKNETQFLYDAEGKQLEIGEWYDTYFEEGEE